MRIALGGISHETNTYADAVTGPTGLERFVIQRGDRMLKVRGTETFMAGFLDGCDEMIVTSQPFRTMDAEIFLLHGIDVTRCSVVGLKSSQHFRAGFGHLAGVILTADAPGLTTNHVEVFDHQRAGRALWPAASDSSMVSMSAHATWFPRSALVPCCAT